MHIDVERRAFEEIALRLYQIKRNRGRSPGLVAMGRDSHSIGCGFESRHRILDGHFITYICFKNRNVCLKRPKINEKEAGIGPFFKKIKRNSWSSNLSRSHQGGHYGLAGKMVLAQNQLSYVGKQISAQLSYAKQMVVFYIIT